MFSITPGISIYLYILTVTITTTKHVNVAASMTQLIRTQVVTIDTVTFYVALCSASRQCVPGG